MLIPKSGLIRLDTCDEAMVRGLAALHRQTLAESIFARVGEPFLRYSYARLYRSDDAFGWAYVADGRPVGLVTCVTDFNRWVRYALWRHGAAIAATVLAGVVRHPSMLRDCWSAMTFLHSADQRGDRQPAAEIVSFGVDPWYRRHAPDSTPQQPQPTPFYERTGVAIAEELFRAAVEGLAGRGARRLRIMTLADNPASNRFYARYGCEPAVAVRSYLGVPVQLYETPIERVVESLRRQAVTA